MMKMIMMNICDPLIMMNAISENIIRDGAGLLTGLGGRVSLQLSVTYLSAEFGKFFLTPETPTERN